LTLLRLADEAWSAEDWQVFFDERAGIAEFDGGLSRAQAEARAFACCAVEWLNRNPVRLPPGRCLDCGGGDHAHDPVLPFDVEITEAVAALEAMGIAAPADLPDDFGKNGGM
jgi:hypothetical protein